MSIHGTTTKSSEGQSRKKPEAHPKPCSPNPDSPAPPNPKLQNPRKPEPETQRALNLNPQLKSFLARLLKVVEVHAHLCSSNAKNQGRSLHNKSIHDRNNQPSNKLETILMVLIIIRLGPHLAVTKALRGFRGVGALGFRLRGP